MTALRGTAARIARLQQSLSGRELAVLDSLQRLRLLTTDQIRRLHVASGSAKTQDRRTRSLLRRLADRGLVVRLTRAVGGESSGSLTTPYCLSGLGQAVIATSAATSRRRRTCWQTTPYFQAHMLAVSEQYVQVVEACRHGAAELLTFDGEPSCWRRFSGPSGYPLTLKPDAFVRVAVGDYELTSFLEVDRGRESLPTIRRKCRLYLNYWRSGLEQQTTGVFPRVLWLVPDQRRLEGLSGSIRQLDPESAALFAVALDSDGAALTTTLPQTAGVAA